MDKLLFWVGITLIVLALLFPFSTKCKYSGTIEYIKSFDKVLTQEEVEKLYNELLQAKGQVEK